MKINGQYPKLPVQEKNVDKGKEGKELSSQQGVSAEKAERATANRGVNSNFAVNRLREKINQEADVDMDRVKALKAKIKSGEYQIDNLKLANRILKSSITEDL